MNEQTKIIKNNNEIKALPGEYIVAIVERLVLLYIERK